ncbi:MAG: hypothetical protein ACE5F1_09865, partial [Planctomycetota bacterium]
VRLAVSVSFEKTPALPPKLFLRRRGESPGKLFPMRGTLRSGDQMAVMSVPKGEYEMDVLPLGLLTAMNGVDTLHIGSDGAKPRRIEFEENRELVELVLHGIPEGELPLTVAPLRVESAMGGDADVLFCGPYRWSAPSQKIPRLPYACRIVVKGRSGYWLSSQRVTWEAPVTRVDLIRASRLELSWFPGSAELDPIAIVEFRSGRTAATTGFRPGLVQVAGSVKPVLKAVLIVPRVAGTLDCRKRPGGQVLWRRRVRMQRAVENLEVRE